MAEVSLKHIKKVHPYNEKRHKKSAAEKGYTASASRRHPDSIPTQMGLCHLPGSL